MDGETNQHKEMDHCLERKKTLFFGNIKIKGDKLLPPPLYQSPSSSSSPHF